MMQSPQPLSLPSWPDLKCFQHCDRNTNIVCCVVPSVCPVCRQDVSLTPMRIPPYVLPSPFVSSKTVPCGLVLKPTSGDFIRDYTGTANLHIGVTDSRGHVYDFDEEGLHTGSVWPQALPVPMPTQSAAPGCVSRSTWDQSVAAFADPHRWNQHRYDEIHCNCFDFVLGFLHYAGLQSTLGRQLLSSKAAFCEQFLMQKTAKASQYVHLYRTVLKDGYVLSNASFL